MDNRDILSRLKEKFSLAATSTASFFYFFILGIAVIFLILLIAIQFGWSTIAGMIFGVAAMGATLFCMLLNTIMSRFGKGRAVFLGIIVLYLNLMSALAFSAPEFFSGLSLKKWMALNTIFFTATSGGSLALVSYERASRIVSIVIILLNSMVLVPDNSFIKGLINAISGHDMSYRSSLVEAARHQANENNWETDERATKPVFDSLKAGKVTRNDMRTLDNIEAARDAQSPVAKAVSLLNGTTVQVTIKDLDPITVYGIPDGRHTFTIEGKDPIIFTMLPDPTSPTGMSAVKNSLEDPSFTIVTEDGVTNGGTTIIRNGRVTLRLRVPPDAEANIKSGRFSIAESTVTVKFK